MLNILNKKPMVFLFRTCFIFNESVLIHNIYNHFMHALIKMYVYVCLYVYSLLTNYLYNLYINIKN